MELKNSLILATEYPTQILTFVFFFFFFLRAASTQQTNVYF